MRKAILASLVILAGLALATNILAQSDRQTYSDFMYRRISSGAFTPIEVEMTTNGAGYDTTGVIWFQPDLVPYGTLWMKFAPLDSTATTCYVPDLAYKFVDQNSKFWSSDSNQGWTSILTTDSLKVTITAKDTVRWVKYFDFRAQCPAGIAIRGLGNVAHDSTRCIMRFKGAKLLGTDKDPSRPGTY